MKILGVAIAVISMSAALEAVADAKHVEIFRPGAVWPDDKGVHINAHGGGVLFDHGTYCWFMPTAQTTLYPANGDAQF